MTAAFLFAFKLQREYYRGGKNLFTPGVFMKHPPMVAVEDCSPLHCNPDSTLSSLHFLGITEEDTHAVGFDYRRIHVHESMIELLMIAQDVAKMSGYTLTIIGGWLPEALYNQLSLRACSGRMSQHARYLMKSRVHATGLAVDVLLWDKRKKEPVALFRKEDGERALFQGYYGLCVEGRDVGRVINKDQRRREEKYRRQQILINAMMRGEFTTKPLGLVCHYVHRSIGTGCPTPKYSI